MFSQCYKDLCYAGPGNFDDQGVNQNIKESSVCRSEAACLVNSESRGRRGWGRGQECELWDLSRSPGTPPRYLLTWWPSSGCRAWLCWPRPGKDGLPPVTEKEINCHIVSKFSHCIMPALLPLKQCTITLSWPRSDKSARGPIINSFGHSLPPRFGCRVKAPPCEEHCCWLNNELDIELFHVPASSLHNSFLQFCGDKVSTLFVAVCTNSGKAKTQNYI